MEARRPGWVNWIELLTATLLLASFVLAVTAMIYSQRPFGERLCLAS